MVLTKVSLFEHVIYSWTVLHCRQGRKVHDEDYDDDDNKDYDDNEDYDDDEDYDGEDDDDEDLKNR